MPVYTPPGAPPPTYPCGHCGEMIPRVIALHQAGYCERCEFMTAIEVMRYTLVTRSVLLGMEYRGEIHPARIDSRPYYHRAEIVNVAQVRERKRSSRTLPFA